MENLVKVWKVEKSVQICESVQNLAFIMKKKDWNGEEYKKEKLWKRALEFVENRKIW